MPCLLPRPTTRAQVCLHTFVRSTSASQDARRLSFAACGVPCKFTTGSTGSAVQRALPCACKACPARRQALLALPVAAVLALVNQGPAQAGLLEGVAKQITRPDVFDDVSATVALMDAASVLSEIQVCTVGVSAAAPGS